MPKVVGFDEREAQRVTCKDCGAINEYFRYEIEHHKTNKDYTGGYDLVRGIICGNCREVIRVKD